MEKDLNNSNYFQDLQNDLDIKQLSLIFQRRKKLIAIIFMICFLSVVSYTAYKRKYAPVYKGSFSLMINDPINSNDRRFVQDSPLSRDGLLESLARNNTRNDIPTLIELMKSSYLLEPLSKDFNISVSNLKRRILIKMGGGTTWDATAKGILKVRLLSNNPKRDKILLKRLSDVYLETALQQRQRRIFDGITFLNNQAPILTEKTNLIQNELKQFREKNTLLEPYLESESLKKKESNLNSELITLKKENKDLLNLKQQIIEGNLIALELFNEINNKSRNSIMGNKGLTFTVSDQSSLREYSLLKDEIAKASSKYLPTSTVISSLNQRLEKLRPILLKKQIKSVDVAINLNQNSIDNLNEQISNIKTLFIEQPNLIKEYESIKQRLVIARQNLTSLFQARERFQLELAQESVPWRLIEKPIFLDYPISPNIFKYISAGTFLSLFASFFGVFLYDKLDNKFHSSEEVEEDLKTTLIGYIPFIPKLLENIKISGSKSVLEILEGDEFSEDKLNSLKKDKYKRFAYEESIRGIFTSLRFLKTDQKLKTISITSCNPSEGKTLTTILLAKVIAELGKKVLLIDADLKKPSVHKKMSLNNLRGLSNLITEDELSFEDVIQKNSKYENFDIITAGRIPPDSTRLLSSNRMKKLLEDIESKDIYDYIIVDTTPNLFLSDASLVSNIVDGTILLVSLNNVNKDLPLRSIQKLKKTEGTFLGVITNSINKDSMLYDNSNYGYGYGYGYKYGYGNLNDYIDNGEEEISNKLIGRIKNIIKKIRDLINF